MPILSDHSRSLQTMRRIIKRVTGEIANLSKAEAGLLEKIGSYGEALVSEKTPESQQRLYLITLQDLNKQYVEARKLLASKRAVILKAKKKETELCEYASQHHV